jgi:hypothetical protein
MRPLPQEDYRGPWPLLHPTGQDRSYRPVPRWHAPDEIDAEPHIQVAENDQVVPQKINRAMQPARQGLLRILWNGFYRGTTIGGLCCFLSVFWPFWNRNGYGLLISVVGLILLFAISSRRLVLLIYCTLFSIAGALAAFTHPHNILWFLGPALLIFLIHTGYLLFSLSVSRNP